MKKIGKVVENPQFGAMGANVIEIFRDDEGDLFAIVFGMGGCSSAIALKAVSAGGVDERAALEAIEWLDDFVARCNGDDRGACESVNIIRAALTATAPNHSEQVQSCATCNGVGIVGHSALCPECAAAPSAGSQKGQE